MTCNKLWSLYASLDTQITVAYNFGSEARESPVSTGPAFELSLPYYYLFPIEFSLCS